MYWEEEENMKHYKGLLCGLAAVVLALGAVRIVSLNKALPSPEDKPVTVGKKFIYKGLEGTVGDVEIYNKEEMQTAYPDIELEMDGLDDSHISDSTYIVANVKMTNNTQDTVYMGKTGVALMAGFIIIPACFAYNVELDSGPSLLFITLPNVFNNMAGGRIWGCAFFIFMSFAALSTVIAVFENILSFFMDGMGWSRKKAVLVNIVAISILSLPAVLGYNVWSGIHPVGSQSTIMDLEDFLVSNNLLPLGSLLFVLFCTKKNGWGFENFLAEVNTGEGMKFPKKIRFYMTYILPWIIVIIYLKGYYDMFSPMGTKVLVGWMIFAAILLAGIYLISFGILNKKKKQNV